MAESVGQIGLDLVLNSSGFKRQLNSINATAKSASDKVSSSFKKIATTAVAAFSVKKIADFGKECQSLANAQIEAETKLKTVMKQRMKATESSIKGVEQLASAQQKLGVVGDEVQLAGAQQLATFLNTNTALEKLIPAMNNLAVQQNGVNVTAESMTNIGNMMGKVMQGQTSALTRVGITFTDAQEKMLKYGNEEQRAATLAQVITDNVGNMNKAIASTPAGKMQQIKNSFGDIQETLGRAINNVFSPMLSYISKILSGLETASKKFEDFTKALFGDSNNNPASNLSQAASSADDMTTEVDNASASLETANKSAEKLKNNLAGFDKLNVISKQTSNTSNTSSAPVKNQTKENSKASNTTTKVTNKGLKNAFSNLYEKSGFKDFVDKVQCGIDNVDWSAIGENCKSIFKSAVPIAKSYIKGVASVGKAVLGTVGSYVSGVIQVSGKNLQTLTGGIAKWLNKDGLKIQKFISDYYNHIKNGFNNLSTFFDGWFNLIGASIDRMRPTMENSISNLLSGFTNFGVSVGTIVSEGFEIATSALAEWVEKDSATIGAFFDTIQSQISDVMNLIGTVFNDIGTIISDWWNGEDGGSVIFQNICDMFTNIGTTLMNVYNNWIKPVWDFIVEVVMSAWENALKPVFSKITKFFGKVANLIAELWDNYLSPIVNWLVDVFKPIFVNVFNAIKGVFDTVFSFIGDVVGGFIDALSGLIDFITGVFTGDWKKAWTGIKDFFKGIWDGIWGAIKGVINLIIDGINLLWTGIYTVVSGIVDAIGGISGAIGDIFGADWEFSMPEEPPLIPKLAKGGLVKAPTLALVGDNKGASTGNPEVVAPLNKLQGMINSSSNPTDTAILSEILSVLKKIYELFLLFRRQGGSSYEFVAKLSGSVLFDEIVKQDRIYRKCHGGKSAFS